MFCHQLSSCCNNVLFLVSVLGPIEGYGAKHGGKLWENYGNMGGESIYFSVFFVIYIHIFIPY